MKIGIIGAGMAGLSCAHGLAEQGHSVRLFDKGRGPGGRMSTRRIPTPAGEAMFDHGAQYFTARDPSFRRMVAQWYERGLVARWPDNRGDAWVGVPAMNAVIRDLAAPRDVHFSEHVRSIERSGESWCFRLDSGHAGPFDIAIVAVPPEQAAPLLSLHDFEMACVALRARSRPSWTGLFAFAERLPTPLDILRDRSVIAWAARNSAKPDRSGPESWVVQAQPAWTEAHCEDPADTIAAALLDALAEELAAALPPPLAMTAHRWRFAMSNGTGDGALWNGGKRLGACGDWLVGPRVESAWLSGQALAGRIGECLGARLGSRGEE